MAASACQVWQVIRGPRGARIGWRGAAEVAENVAGVVVMRLLEGVRHGLVPASYTACMTTIREMPRRRRDEPHARGEEISLSHIVRISRHLKPEFGYCT